MTPAVDDRTLRGQAAGGVEELDDLALAGLPEGTAALPQGAWAEMRQESPGEFAPRTAEDPAILRNPRLCITISTSSILNQYS